MASVVWCENKECEYCDRSGFCTREVFTVDEYGVCGWRKNEMNDTKQYLVVYKDCTGEINLEMFKATNAKDCIIQFAIWVGDDSKLFRKSLMGCESDSECIEMYKQFGSCVINAIYEVNNVV